MTRPQPLHSLHGRPCRGTTVLMSFAVLTLAAALAGGGLAGTSATTAAGAASEAEEARQGQQIEQQVKDKLQAAQEAEAAKRAAADKDSL